MMNNNQLNHTGSNGYQAETITVNNHVHPEAIKNRSIIADVVNIIANLPLESTPYIARVLPEEVQIKIRHNNVTRCKYIIESYKSCNIIDLDNVYDILEEERPGRKSKLNTIINNCYKQELSKLNEKQTENILVLKVQSDSILENIIQNLKRKVLESSNLNADNEDIEITLNLIVATAFIECLVLENPKEVK